MDRNQTTTVNHCVAMGMSVHVCCFLIRRSTAFIRA